MRTPQHSGRPLHAPVCSLLVALATPALHAQVAWGRPYIPDGRANHGMSYDPARDRVFLFGGTRGESCEIVNETWAFNGTNWSPLAVAAPPPRLGHGMVYDSARSRTVMFGGSDGSAWRNDTWEFDGNTWTLGSGNGSPGSPGQRVGHAVAFDAARGVTVLFGGFAVSGADQTWTWNGTAWSNVTPPSGSPGPRRYHAMAYDSVRQRVVMFGGDMGPQSDETWEWDGTSWTHLTAGLTVSPPARERHSMAFDANRGRIVVFGGLNSSQGGLNDVWELDMTASTWRQVVASTATPSPRSRTALVYDTNRQKVLLMGGVATTTVEADTWSLQSTSWTQLASLGNSGPVGRHTLVMAYDPVRERTVLFGGGLEGGYSDETWEWDGTTWSQRFPAQRPPPRVYHATAYDRARQRVVIHGGLNLQSLGLDDTWEWDGTDWALRETGATDRRSHAMAYDPVGQRVIMVGGNHRNGAYDGNTMAWTGTTWIALPANGLCPRSGFALTTDFHRGRVVLFGGEVPFCGASTDTLEWDGTSWTDMAPTRRPLAREWPGMAYDTVRRVTVMFGGQSGSPATHRGDVWEWDGTIWTERFPAVAPCPRSAMGMVFDEARGNCVIQGGGSFASYTLWDTWLYGSQFPTGFVPFGAACPGSAGTPRLANDRFPFVNRTFAVTLSQARAGTAALLLLGGTDFQAPGVPLAGIGAPGCFLHLLPDLGVYAIATDSGGRASFGLTLPNDPSLFGGVFFSQYSVIDPGFNAAQLVFTNGGRGTIGSF